MKKIVLLTALLCLFIAFQSVFADWTAPEKRDLTYDGTDQYLVTAGVPASSNQKFFYRDPYTGKWGKDIPSGRYPGVYSVEWIMIDGDQTEPPQDKGGTIIKDIYIKEYDQPQARTDIVYDGSSQYLIDVNHAGTTLDSKNKDTYYFRDLNTGRWEKTVPYAVAEGIYNVEYLLWGPDAPDDSEKGYTISNIEILKDSSSSHTVSPIYPDPEHPAKEFKPFIPSNSGNSGNQGSNNGGSSNNGSNSGSNGSSSNSGSSGIHFYEVGNGSRIFDDSKYLPATGFPTRFSKPLAIQPETVRYENLSMRIQIPTINVDVELAGVPEIGDTWAVEWLGDRAGMLSGSAMPGEGYTMVAAHNHLNTQEIGPFGFLFDLDENDRIFVNMPDGSLKIYSVYANELLEPNDFSQMASISENEDGSLILVTCENEMINGSYQNRRVVFAKLMN
ncbi:MAG: class F sortase [Flexilinea sp.]|nr:class F sortase [Flexilinea sp.]